MKKVELLGLENEQKRGKKMKLIENNHGEKRTLAEGHVEDIVKYLKANDLFTWILEEEPDREMPSFDGIETARELRAIFDDHDYSWWHLKIEES